MTNITRYIGAGLVIATISISSIMYVYWSLWPNDIYIIRNNVNEQGQPCEPDRSHDGSTYYRGCGLEAYPDQVSSPGIVYYDADYCDVTTATGDVEILLINIQTSQQFGKKEVPLKFVEGHCVEIPGAPFNVPHGVLPGDYYLRFRAIAKVTPLQRTIAKETQSLKFHIDPVDSSVVP